MIFTQRQRIQNNEFSSPKNANVSVITVDLAATGNAYSANVSPQQIAAHHPNGVDAVFTSDCGSTVAGMALAFEKWTEKNRPRKMQTSTYSSEPKIAAVFYGVSSMERLPTEVALVDQTKVIKAIQF